MIQAGNDDRRSLPQSLMSDWGPRTPMVFAAFAVVATIIAGFAHPGAGLAILVLGILTLVAVDFGAWFEDEAKRGQGNDGPGRAELARSVMEHLAFGPRTRMSRPTAPPMAPTDLVPVQFGSAIPPRGEPRPTAFGGRPMATAASTAAGAQASPTPAAARPSPPSPSSAAEASATPAAPGRPSRVRVGRPMPD